MIYLLTSIPVFFIKASLFVYDLFMNSGGITLIIRTGKPYGLFYSHGGGGNVRSALEDLFRQMGTKVGTTIASQGRPNASVLSACRALGQQLANAVQKR